jgi:hypothetical protein
MAAMGRYSNCKFIGKFRPEAAAHYLHFKAEFHSRIKHVLRVEAMPLTNRIGFVLPLIGDK